MSRIPPATAPTPEHGDPSAAGGRQRSIAGLEVPAGERPAAGTVARGTLLGVGGQAWHLVTALAVYAYLARYFGPALFGTWRVTLSVLAWLEVFVTAGLVRMTTQTISRSPEDEASVARAAYIGQIATGVALFVVVQIVATPVARLLSEASLAPLLRVAALDIPLYAVFMAASSVVLGTRHFERQAVAWVLYATSKAVFVIGAVFLGFSVTGALIGNAMSDVVGFAVVFRPSRGLAFDWSQVVPRLRTMFVAVPFLTMGLIEGVELGCGLWLVSAIVANGVQTGLFAAAAALAEIPVFLFLGLDRVIFPSVASARAQGDFARASDYANQSVRLAVIVTVVGIASVAGAGRQILELIYSSRYAAAFVPLVLLMTAGAGRTIRTVCTEVLLAEDRRRTVLMVLLSTTTLEIALVSALAFKFGLVGAAAGGALCALAAAVWAAVLLRDLLGVKPLVTLARSVGAAAVVGSGLALWSPSPALVPLALLLAGVAYLVLLRLIGEFSAEDRATLRVVFARGNAPAPAERGAAGPAGAAGSRAPRRPAQRLLVVNADDMGWSRSVNAGIVEAHRTGIVTRASIIATGRAFEHAVELASATPTLAVGVHLEMYRDCPLLPVDRVSSLVGENGMFLGSSRAIIRKLISRAFDMSELEAEFRAQIQRVIGAGIRPSHVDSEKHLHLWPPLFDMVCDLASEFSIPYVRVVREPPGTRLIPLGLTILSARNHRVAQAHGLRTPDRTIGVTTSPTDRESLARLLAAGRGDCVELVVHPGHIDEEFWEIQEQLPNMLTYERQEQFNVLARIDALSLVEQFGYTLDPRNDLG